MNGVLRRHQLRLSQRPPTLNLVSLMDIFTILVFFLMVNANTVEVLETSIAIRLPDSVALDKPEERLVIQLEQSRLLLNGAEVMAVDELMAGDKEVHPVLLAALTAARLEKSRDGNLPAGVNLMGDRELPYNLLKRVMRTCQAASLLDIALAVNQVKGGAS